MGLAKFSSNFTDLAVSDFFTGLALKRVFEKSFRFQQPTLRHLAGIFIYFFVLFRVILIFIHLFFVNFYYYLETMTQIVSKFL